MYGLKEAAVLAYQQLSRFLALEGYTHVRGTAGLFTHNTRRTAFTLCVDDIGVKYCSQEDLAHLLQSLRKHYKLHVDEEGTHYMGLTMNWNYRKRFVDISMPNYIPQLLERLNHKKPLQPQYSPHEYNTPKYNKKGEQQLARPEDTTKLLGAKEKTEVQSVVGALLYYARAIDNTILTALNEIAAAQSAPTEKTRKACNRLLDYVATYPNVKLRFHASDMQLHVDSDAAYLVAPKARSRIAGYYSFPKRTNNTIELPGVNHPILIECKTLRHVVASAAEAETAALFHNAQIIIPMRRILRALGHIQKATPLKTDNLIANGFVHNNIHLRKSKGHEIILATRQ